MVTLRVFSVLLLLLLQAEPALADGCPQPSFAAARTFEAGDNPASVAVGDFNGDGKQDLAVANEYSANVSVLLGEGNGSFQTAVNYSVSEKYPRFVAVSDVNGDGKLDLIVVNNGGVSGQGNVSVLCGKGDGTFQMAVNYAAGAGPSSVAIGDFDGDGKPDLAVANYGGYYQGYFTNSSVSVLLGKGDGSFQAAVNYGAGNGASSVAIGDFNGDGKSDLAVANISTGNVSVLMGKGDGTFQSAVNYGVGAAPYSVAAGDFNGDGKIDLALAKVGYYDASSNTYTNTGAAVLLGNGDGTFQPAVNYPVGPSPSCVAVADFNGDGKSDLAVADYSGTTAILLSRGDGTFEAASNFNQGGRSLAVGDFNSDGKADLALVPSGEAVAVVLGHGDGSFLAAGFVSAGPGSASTALGDFNGDGRPDLVVGKILGDWGLATDVSVLLANGDGTFQPPLNSRAGYNPFAVTVADFNGDGRADLATANNSSGDVSILLGDGDGTFRAPVKYAVGSASVAAGDFNGDGKPDLAAATGDGVSVLLNKGDGIFSPAGKYSGGGGFVTVADLDRNGKLDLISAGAYSDITVFLGNGDGSFRAGVFYGAGYWLYSPSVAVGDFNGDGTPDLAVTGLADGGRPGSLVVLLGNGDGTFQTAVGYPGGGSSIAVGDFNGDGKLDLVTSRVSVLLGNGDGTFQTPITYSGGGGSVAVSDLNGDGKPDLAVATYNGVSLLLHLCFRWRYPGRCAQQRCPHPFLAAPLHPFRSRIGDKPWLDELARRLRIADDQQRPL